MALLTFTITTAATSAGQAITTNRVERINVVGDIVGEVRVQVAHANVAANYQDILRPLQAGTYEVGPIPVGWFLRVINSATLASVIIAAE